MWVCLGGWYGRMSESAWGCGHDWAGPACCPCTVTDQTSATHPAAPPPCHPATHCRLEGLDLLSLGFTTLLVDPPRAGLDAQTVQLLREFQSVVYVSCNPGG